MAIPASKEIKSAGRKYQEGNNHLHTILATFHYGGDKWKGKVKDNLTSNAETERRKHSVGMRIFLGLRKTERKPTIVKCNPLETIASMDTLKSDDVSKVRHPSKSCLELMKGDDEGVGLMGSKRVLKENLDSPSKRFRGSSTYDLQAISGYPNKVVEDLQKCHYHSCKPPK